MDSICRADRIQSALKMERSERPVNPRYTAPRHAHERDIPQGWYTVWLRYRRHPNDALHVLAKLGKRDAFEIGFHFKVYPLRWPFRLHPWIRISGEKCR